MHADQSTRYRPRVVILSSSRSADPSEARFEDYQRSRANSLPARRTAIAGRHAARRHGPSADQQSIGPAGNLQFETLPQIPAQNTLTAGRCSLQANSIYPGRKPHAGSLARLARYARGQFQYARSSPLLVKTSTVSPGAPAPTVVAQITERPSDADAWGPYRSTTTSTVVLAVLTALIGRKTSWQIMSLKATTLQEGGLH